MRFKSYIPALYVLTTQLDSLSNPSRPHNLMNFCAFPPSQKLRRAGLSVSIPRPDKNRDCGISTSIPNAAAKIQIKIYIFEEHVT